jgi:hypothetical protein
MRNFHFAIALGALCLIGAPATAAITRVNDPVGDIVASYTGPPLPPPADLDVTKFTVGFDGSNFNLSATMAGPISTTSGFYVIGVNRGAAGPSPFTAIGHPGVIFDALIILQQDATGVVNLLPGMASLAAGAVTISGPTISVVVPVGALPSNGFDPGNYGFNIWPRSSAAPAGNGAITDFAPDNTTIAAVPEPGVWALMLVGVGLVGFALRRRRALV